MNEIQKELFLVVAQETKASGLYVCAKWAITLWWYDIMYACHAMAVTG
jgi:hypothetical protein